MPSRIARALAVAASFFLAAPARPATRDDFARPFREATDALARDVERLESARNRMLGRLAATPAANRILVARLTFVKAVTLGDLRMELVLENAKPVLARCWSAQWDIPPLELDDPGSVTVTGSPDTGEIAGELSFMAPVALAFDDAAPKLQKAVLKFRGAVVRGEVKGSFKPSGALGENPGGLTGTLADVGSDCNPPRDLPRPRTGGSDLAAIHATGRGLERLAIRRYREIRAADAAARLRLPLARCLARSTWLPPVRTPLDLKKPGAAMTGGASPPAPDIGDVGADLGLEDSAGRPATKPDRKESAALSPGEQGAAADALRALRAAVSLTQRMTSAAESALTRTPGVDAPAALVDTSADPLFGPWYGFAPLPALGATANVLDATAGGDGAQNWPYVTQWKLIGPVPRSADLPTPDLPEFLADFETTYELWKPQHQGGPTGLVWLAIAEAAGTGSVYPPPFREVGRLDSGSGRESHSFYYATQVHSEKDAELYVAAMADDIGRLWLNDEFLGGWPTNHHDRDVVSPVAVFRARFRKGANRFLLRVDHDEDHTGFWVRVCTRGKPRDAAVAARETAALDAHVAALRHMPGNIRGWHGDWTGNFSNATPVTAWNLARGINVRWRIPLPQSKATPVLAGDRILTTIDPFFLVCVNKDDGRLLWERECNILEIENPEIFARSRAMYAAYRQAWGELVKHGCSPYEREATLGEREDELNKKVSALYKPWWELIAQNARCVKDLAWGNGWSGHAFATPVTDGTNVWIKTSASSAACFDLEGNRKWMVRLETIEHDFGHIASPTLADGKLIMQIDVPQKKGAKDSQVFQKLLALDAANGKTAWWSEPYVNMQPADAPRVMRLTNGRETMTVVVTGGGSGMLAEGSGTSRFHCGGGAVVRVEDGQTLIRDTGVDSGYHAPIVHRDVVFHFGWQETATRLVMVDRDHVGAVRLWTRGTCLAGLDFDGGLVYDDGLLCGQAGGQWHKGYWVFDAATGAAVRRTGHVGRGGAGRRAYIPNTAAGGYLFFGDMGSGFGKGYYAAHPCPLVVFRLGRDGRCVANNLLDHHVMSAPTFEGDRMYIRSDWSLYCIAPSGREGRAYEAEENAKNVLADFRLDPPPPREARALKPRSVPGKYRTHHKGDGNVTDLGSTRDIYHYANQLLAYADWMALGPFPRAEKEQAAATVIRDPSALFSSPSPVTIAGRQYRPDCRTHAAFERPKTLTNREGRTAINISGAIGLKSNTVGYLYTVLMPRAPQTYRVYRKTWGGDARVWFAGQIVEDGDRLTIEPGAYPVLVEGEVGERPDGLALYMELVDSETVEAETARWRDSIRNHRDILERIAAYLPDTDDAKKAAALLEAAEGGPAAPRTDSRRHVSRPDRLPPPQALARP